ncbi:flagellar assembly peptidoglycan hydrolase FlgJ [Lysobacter koreensis]|uniref:Peptidoglycan hydrolase FlgJ n=1 Tax=Lysobacter koreensis TaxID=266122 RepID=A0ABW2YLV3_9GAMM
MRLPSATAIALEPSSTPPRARIEKAARELETQFAQMLIKSMRSASMGDSLMGDNTTYREMYDQQLARELSKGRGLGLAPMIVRQLERSTQAAAPAGATSPSSAPTSLPLSAPIAPMPLAAPVGALSIGGLPGAVPATLMLAPSRAGVSMPGFATPALATPAFAAAQDLAATCPPDAPLDCSSPEAFVQSIWPHAQKTAAELGVPAKALVAQAALETGWGRRLVGRQGVTSHNLFGIKAGSKWAGERMSSATHEFVDGVRRNERADFRAYGSPADSFADYARLLGNARYAGARGAGDDTHRFASALQKAGYATDPSYAAKITAIANGATLNRALAALPGSTHVASVATPAVSMTAATHLTAATKG